MQTTNLSPSATSNVLSDDEQLYSTPQPLPMTPIEPFSDSERNDEFVAIEALRQLKSGGSTPKVDTEEDGNDEAPEGNYRYSNDQDRKRGTIRSGDNQEIESVSLKEGKGRDAREEEETEQFYDTINDLIPSRPNTSTNSSISDRPPRKKSRFLNTAFEAYSKSQAIKYGVGIMERATQPMVNIIEQKSSEWKRKRRLSRTNQMFPDDVREYTTRAIGTSSVPLVRNSLTASFALSNTSSSTPQPCVNVGVSSSSVLESLSTVDVDKKQKLPSIAEALARGNELSLSMSIESRKRLSTCLQLLKLANNQLSHKIAHLQDLVNKEQELIRLRQKRRTRTETGVIENEDDDNEVYHDASDTSNSTYEIKQEIVGTVKKVVSFISKYAGKSLAEPERSSVRQALLKLPSKWATQASNSILDYNTNGKVLVLANESLDMVSSVMSVFDESLAKAELWIKKKQEKQLAKKAILNNSLKRQRERE